MLGPGAELDARGTQINAELLTKIISVIRGKGGIPEFGKALFTQSHFTERAAFEHVRFLEEANFSYAQFDANAGFDDVHFAGVAHFGHVKCEGHARFNRTDFASWANFNDARFLKSLGFEDAKFANHVHFQGSQFGGIAGFQGSQFKRNAFFNRAQFHDSAWFESTRFDGIADFNGGQFNNVVRFLYAQFSEEVDFRGVRIGGLVAFGQAQFQRATQLGPLAAEQLDLSKATFGSRVVIEAAANHVSCHGTEWRDGVTMRLRYARTSLEHAAVGAPSSVTGADRKFEDRTPSMASPFYLDDDPVRNRAVEVGIISRDDWMPTLVSLPELDATNISVADVNLSACRFGGVHLLDQVRLEGRLIFDRPPRGMRRGRVWPPIWHWSTRQTLAEERTWRATTRKYAGWANTRNSKLAEVGPERLAGLYRQLRKGLEDAKNEPGAADFYYGEMEMRRHARTTPTPERVIIWLYWLISGYGLRAVRSIAVLVILGVIITTALTGWGLAATTPVTTLPQHLAGTILTTPHRPTRINATLSGITPRLPPPNQRWTSERSRTALEVTLESFAFRSTDQPLTTAGTWTTIAARLLGPVLLALALLAVRNRVKR